MIRLATFGICVAVCATVWGASGEDPGEAVSRRRAVLAELRSLLPASEPWEAWLKRSGELPPDFNRLPTVPFLPDPLRTESGDKVKPASWTIRREEVLLLLQHYIYGSAPAVPDNVRVAGSQSREEAGAFIEQVTLEFGPDHRARLFLELIVPKQKGPFPILLIPSDQRQWGLVAVSRGYVACVYAASEARDDTTLWRRLWPEADWGTLMRRAWAASRCLDHLLTLPFVDRNRVALAGHGSNGKSALIAAAIDPRIKAVVASSSGVGASCSFRLFSEAQFGEGIELVTRRYPDWFHPRLRFFAGRENRLPVDAPQLVACVAPRPCLLASAYNDAGESLWAVEHTYYSARRVYELLGKGQELNLVHRPGGHEAGGETVETYFDWLDTVLGRSRFAFPDAVVFPLYGAWQQLSGEEPDLETFPEGGMGDILAGSAGLEIKTVGQWVQKRDPIRARMLWGIGQAPAFALSRLEEGAGEPVSQAILLDRGEPLDGIEKRTLNFGNNVTGDFYVAARKGPGKRPAVIWIHPISVATGYVAGRRRGEHPHVTLAREGFGVLAFDQIGNGRRIAEVRNFYPRYPYWSILGKQVEDTLAGVDALQAMEGIDPKRVYLLGYGTGAIVALHCAALDDRVAGVVSVAGMTSMRRDTMDQGTGGVARWSGWMVFQPRLGAFVGKETRIPYDYHEVLGMIAPRPAAVFTPRIDYQATPADLQWCVTEAKKVYALFGTESRLQFHVLNDYNRFSPESQKTIFEVLRVMAGARALK